MKAIWNQQDESLKIETKIGKILKTVQFDMLCDVFEEMTDEETDEKYELMIDLDANDFSKFWVVLHILNNMEMADELVESCLLEIV